MEKLTQLSICMIVKNEQDVLASCLDSLLPLGAEMIVVDTGSTDKTLDVLEQYGLESLSFAWCNDFAAARNFSLQHATRDWILVVDADEMLSDEGREVIALLCKTNEKKAYLLTQRHYTNDSRLSGFVPCQGVEKDFERNYLGYFESSCVRLFPRSKDIEFRGEVHELVEWSIQESKICPIEHSHIILHHYGHTPEVRQKKDKGDLYTPLGEQKVKKDPGSWKAHYEYAVELHWGGKLDESIEHFEIARNLNPHEEQTWVNAGYVLCSAGRLEEARAVLKEGCARFPHSAEMCCNLGLTFIRQGNWVHAVAFFREALARNERYLLAWVNLGEALALGGMYRDSLCALEKALHLQAKNPDIWKKVAAVHAYFGNHGEAEKMEQTAKQLALPQAPAPL